MLGGGWIGNHLFKAGSGNWLSTLDPHIRIGAVPTTSTHPNQEDRVKTLALLLSMFIGLSLAANHRPASPKANYSSMDGSVTLAWDPVVDYHFAGEIFHPDPGGWCSEGTITENGEFICTSGGSSSSFSGSWSCASECDHGCAWGRVLKFEDGRWKCEYPGTGTRSGLGGYNCSTGNHTH